jgi:hypothetical protein
MTDDLGRRAGHLLLSDAAGARANLRSMIASTSLQDAAALLTVAMDVSAHDELRDLVAEFRQKDDSDELLLAVVALCRSLCIANSTLMHVLDDELTNAQAVRLTDDELLPMAMQVVRTYAQQAARQSESPQGSA